MSTRRVAPDDRSVGESRGGEGGAPEAKAGEAEVRAGLAAEVARLLGEVVGLEQGGSFRSQEAALAEVLAKAREVASRGRLASEVKVQEEEAPAQGTRHHDAAEEENGGRRCHPDRQEKKKPTSQGQVVEKVARRRARRAKGT